MMRLNIISERLIQQLSLFLLCFALLFAQVSSFSHDIDHHDHHEEQDNCNSFLAYSAGSTASGAEQPLAILDIQVGDKLLDFNTPLISRLISGNSARDPPPTS